MNIATDKAHEEIIRLTKANVRQLGDPVLRTKALPVTVFDERLSEELMRMAQIMEATAGVGLAATQVGIVHRSLVYLDKEEIKFLINPFLEDKSDEEVEEFEGCLSFPGIKVLVPRSQAIKVKAQGLQGEEISLSAQDMTARIIQHEMDHLDGILVLDRTTSQERHQAYLDLATQ